MSRKLASIQRIAKIEQIANADKLELAHVLGWRCVVGKDQGFKEGDLACYMEVDAWLPELPEFEFLRKNCWKDNENGKGFRIKTVRLRGQISQGLLMPLSILDRFGKREREEGEDLTELLEVKLYNPPIPAELKGLVKGQFPSFLQKTDETRVQLLQDVLTRHKGMECYLSEKVDGTSATYFLRRGEFGVCSRNLELLESSGNAHWAVARENKIEEKMRAFSEAHGGVDFALQGEIIGPGVNSNPLKLDGKRVLFFNFFDIKDYRYEDFAHLSAALCEMGLERVPLIKMDYILGDNIDEIIKLSEGKSMLNPKAQREGIVIRPLREQFDMQMAQGFGSGRLSFKAVSPEYLLEEE